MKALERVLLEVERRGFLPTINSLCLREGALIEEVFGGSREPHATRARHLFWWWLRDEKEWSYPRIGALFGYDHTTVMDGVAKAGRELGLVEWRNRGRGARRAA